MLWSLFKIILFVVLVAALAFGAGMLIETDAALRVAFGGWEFTLKPLQAVIVGALLLVAVWLFIKLLGLLLAVIKFISGDETAISRYFNRNRERRGFKALADGMMALASGDGREAIAKATKAQRLLNRPELTNLLTAQAAELAGDRRKATETYKALLQDDRTRFVGVRGLMKQKLADGDKDTALQLAQKAFALKPAHEDTQDVLLRLQAEHADWAGARRTLSAKLKHGSLTRDVHKRRDAVLALSEAKDVLDDGKSIEAREAAIEANRLSPDLIPAAVMAARGYVENGKPRYANRVLKKAWAARPHPDLAAAFAAIEPEETPVQRLARFTKFVAGTEGDSETRMLLTELHIAAEDFPAARKALGDLPETEPTARSLTLMAAVERGSGSDDGVVRGWLARALTAPRGPQWICDNCGTVHAEWGPVCSNCSAFDTLSWKEAPAGDLALTNNAAGMLPLIVGALEHHEEEIEEVEPVEVITDEPGPEVRPDVPPAEVDEAEATDTPEDEVKSA